MTDASSRLTSALADRYRIERELGAGGMATVYLAEDLKHDRKVAIKVLKPELAAVLGAERFVQEIKTTAALSHPHILPLFDSGEAGGFLYYVMPYIEGETIRDRLNRETQLGVDEAVRITVEVADALDYAHRHGVIHRDIKPENILLHDGRAMVMDFGIALAVSAAAGGRMTETGLSLGTPHYMSPEQATADKQITARSDVYSLASVLYEMLAGEPPHLGNSAQQIIMKIVTDEARPVSDLRKATPPNVVAAVSRALQKLPADRFASASEFGAALTGGPGALPLSAGAGTAAGSVTRWRRLALGAGVVAAVAVAVLLWTLARRAPGGPADGPIAFTFRPSLNQSQRIGIAISPDGRQILIPAPDSNGVEGLLVRDLASPGVAWIPGAARASEASFSPDGRWVVYDADSKLYKVPVAGGPPVELVDSLRPTGAFWGANGWIAFSASNAGLWRVRESGGEPEQLTRLDSTRREFAHFAPVELPGGKAAIYNSYATPLARSRIEAVEYATGRKTVLVDGAILPRYLDGYLLYVRDGAIFAAPFDPGRLKVLAPAVPVVEDVAWDLTEGSAGYSVSDNGTLVYLKASAWNQERQVVWVDRQGNARPALPRPGQWAEPRISPDGRWLAVTGLDPSHQIWLFDRTRRVLTQLTHSAGASFDPNWMPDSRSLAYSLETPVYDVGRISIDGGTVDTVLMTPIDKLPSAVSADGKLVAYTGYGNRQVTGVAPIDGSRPPVVDDDGRDRANQAFSPDGRWLAYEEVVSDRPQVFVRLMSGGGRRQVSATGGTQPRWTKGGRELVYRDGDAVYAVSFQPATGDPGTPMRLFALRDAGRVNRDRTVGYDVTPDGSEFLMVEPVVRPEVQPVVVIVDWIAQLRKKVPR